MHEDNESMDSAPTIPQGELDLRVQMLDYLFERGHRVNKPLIDAVAHFTYDYGVSTYQQGKIAAKLTAPTGDKEQS